MIEYALLGGGGLAIELFEYMSTENKKLIGYYDLVNDERLSKHLNYLGDEHKEKLHKKVHYIVSSGFLDIRRKMISFIEEKNLIAGSFISKRAYLSQLSKYGKGIVMIPFAACTGNAILGEFVFLNVYASIGHDAVVGNNVVVGPKATITGKCTIGNDVTFGANSALLPGTRIGSNVEISIETFPRKNIGDNKFVMGTVGKTLSF